jgi:alkanesulfonate monooxygenase SsuD/methylene tetrahydromethanopterin reductase-like flavin-dependent oxidoreductase (luciferase family)
VDQLSEGRLIAGLALGGPGHYPAFGLSEEGRVRRFEEGVRLLKLLWTEPRVTLKGEFWQLRDVAVEPKPAQSPHPPIWFGAGNPAGIRRAARMADGWIGAGSSSTDAFRDGMEVLREALSGENRDAAAFAVAKRVYIAVDDDRDRAGMRLRAWFEGFYGRPDLVDDVAVFGSIDACVEGVAAVIRAGARHVVLNPVFDQVEQAELLMADVVPQLGGLDPA